MRTTMEKPPVKEPEPHPAPQKEPPASEPPRKDPPNQEPPRKEPSSDGSPALSIVGPIKSSNGQQGLSHQEDRRHFSTVVMWIGDLIG